MTDKVLLVSKLSSAVNAITALLEENGCRVGTVVSDSQSAIEYANDAVFDMIVINSPLSDCDGTELAIRLSRDTVCGVIILTPAEKASAVGRQVTDYGVVVVTKPINKMLFRQLLGVVRTAQKRYAGLSKENERLRSSLEEAKLINRAKILLMQHLALSEERAHKYIEKQAMDMRVSKVEVAKQVLRTYSARKQ